VLSFGDERTEKVYLTRGFFLPTLSRQEPKILEMGVSIANKVHHGKDLESFWTPLYRVIRDELPYLRKAYTMVNYN